jgi:hypothetical protein
LEDLDEPIVRAVYVADRDNPLDAAELARRGRRGNIWRSRRSRDGDHCRPGEPKYKYAPLHHPS